jgi:hypothetical protein
MDDPAAPGSAPLRRSWGALALATALFALGFAVANRFQLTHGVLYRAAANDWASAATTFGLLSLQALALLAAIALLGRRLFVVAMVLAFGSILLNLGYGQVVNDVIRAGTLAWMAAETRQAGNAMGEFARPLLFAGAQAALAVALLAGARAALRRGGWAGQGWKASTAGLAALVAPSLLAGAGFPAAAAERNVYSLGLEVAFAEPPPPRAPVDLVPVTEGSPRAIVWLVDESIAYPQFAAILAPRLETVRHVDFGMTAALAHCSAPANLALRSGVEVRRAGPLLDLRRTPSIWGYARKAGYRTVLIDGQAHGAPQNLLLPPERALIDDYIASAGDLDTDMRIAADINRRLRTGERVFVYAVLRGVHFQYRDHYPAGLIPPDSPAIRQYETAVEYSKGRFFERLLASVDRENVAVVYTSDHGQNLAEGAVPHCSPSPVPAELHVPLVAFLPERLASLYAGAPRAGHSASQIFPATLGWMGYDRAAVQRRYDNDLDSLPAAYVRFDRDVVPLRKGDPAGVIVEDGFPGARLGAKGE